MTNKRVSPLNTGPFFGLMASVFVVALGYGVALPMLRLRMLRAFWVAYSSVQCRVPLYPDYRRAPWPVELSGQGAG